MYKYDAPENPNRIKNLVGKKFDKLLIVDFLGVTGSNKKEPVWLCSCDCGGLVELRSSSLRRHSINEKSCGCVISNNAADITGEKYGKLTAIRNTGRRNNNGSYIWEFSCACGNVVEREVSSVRRSNSTAKCDICNKDQLRSRKTTHGFSKGDKIYRAWRRIKERCFVKSASNYERYGAIGVSMQHDWVNDFLKFKDYIGYPPEDGEIYTIDRIDNNKGYEEGNIRWATYSQQARNKSKCSLNKTGVTGVTIEDKKWPDGVTYTTYAVAQWKGLKGEPCKKCFSFKKYGEELAFFAACEYREKQIMLLNLQGAGYTENHGK